MATQFEHISIAAVKVLAQLAARKAVESEARAKGQPLRNVAAQAAEYLAAHPKLIGEARERVQRLGLTERNSR